ncbi:S8 family serine peptidase, partial [Candidatus Micrarchaeota archaeon]|nr:S8 family serine peptidase [Candidatus Micrarchaeota archaeon]
MRQVPLITLTIFLILISTTLYSVSLKSASVQETTQKNYCLVIFKENLSQEEIVGVLEDKKLITIYASDDNHTVAIEIQSVSTMPKKVTGEMDCAFAKLALGEYAESVEPSISYQLLLEDSVPMLGVPDVWDQGYYGNGSKVCVIDTGIDYFSSHFPSNFIAKDFITNDWCMDSPTKSTGSTFSHKLNISSQFSSIQIGTWWIFNSTRFDLDIFYPNGTLAATTNLSSVVSNLDGYYTLINLSTNNITGAYSVRVYYKSNSAMEYPTILWGTEITSMSSYYGGDGCMSSPNPVTQGDNKAFYNIHAHDDYYSSHGTHVAGTISKQTEPKGVAPGAELYVAKVFGFSGETSDYIILSAIDWCLDKRVDIISMSLGARDVYNCNDAVAQHVYRKRNQALFVIAAGNRGPSTGTIETPGCVNDALTVGAVDKSGVIASFSSRGPTSQGYMKPDVVAPGVDIVSTVAIDSMGSKSGTSMATPHIAGVAALLLQKYSSLSPSELKASIVSTGNLFENCNNIYGCGLVNALPGISRVYERRSPIIRYVSPGERNNAKLNRSWAYILISYREDNPLSSVLIFNSTNYTMDCNQTHCWYNLTGIEDGRYEYRVTMQDAFGNSRTAPRRRINIDSHAPEIEYTINSIPDNSASMQRRVYFEVSFSEVNKRRAYITYNGRKRTMRCNLTNCWLNTSLRDDYYVYNISMEDRFRSINTTPNRNLTVDTLEPRISYTRWSERSNAVLSRNWAYILISYRED